MEKRKAKICRAIKRGGFRSVRQLTREHPDYASRSTKRDEKQHSRSCTYTRVNLGRFTRLKKILKSTIGIGKMRHFTVGGN